MKKSTLVFRSFAVIIFIAGIAHLASYAAQKNDWKYNAEAPTELNKKNNLPNDTNSIKNTNKTPKTDYIIGKWKVNYDTDSFKGSIVYKVKKEGDYYVAYTYQYTDDKGNTEKAENTETLIIKAFDGYNGTGVYTIEYEQQQYQVECQINMTDENTLKLSYDYYGYGDTETWRKQ